MAQPLVANNFPPVIGTQFCAPNPVDLAITKYFLTSDNYVVTDGTGNLVFKVRGPWLGRRTRMVIVDAAGNPIVTILEKVGWFRLKWKVFRGDTSSDSSELLFSVIRSIGYRFKPKLDVFLANNIAGEVCDFKVKGSWMVTSCVVYAGESSTAVAQSELFGSGRNKSRVTVYPNIDYAFIVAIIVIFHQNNAR